MFVDREKAVAGWLKLLNPDSLRPRLCAAALFLLAYECLKYSVIARLRLFYSNEFRGGNWISSPKYARKVLSRDPKKNPARASCDWLIEARVIDSADVSLIDRIRDHRNAIAHDLIDFLGNAEREIDLELFRSMVEMIHKIDHWWAVNVDLESQLSEANVDDIDVEGITSMNAMILRWLPTIALGSDSDARVLYDGLLKEMSGPVATSNDV